jgi:CDP-glycerol glycerophosphotransferase (TagB/SpsB family)
MALLTSVRQSRVVRTWVRRIGVHRVVGAVHLAQAPLQVVVSALVRRVPRDQRLVALGSPLDRFADNAAYLFLHLSTHRHDNQPALRPVWVSGSRDVVQRLRSQGHRAVTRWSPGGMWTALRAGTFVYSGYRSDVNRWLSPGARTFCLWHGLPIKRVEGAVGKPQGDQRSWIRRLQQVAREPAPDHLLTPSDFVAERFSPAFGVPKERCWQLGYPRNDHLLDDPDAPPDELVWHTESWDRLHETGPVVGLFLTWRDDRVDDVVDDDLLAELAACAVRAGGVLAYKAHYNVSPSAASDIECVRLPADVDLHAYLGLCDVLVTDYSSIALDFLLTDRPVVFFMPDLEDYAAARGFHVDPLSLPGVVTRDRASLVDALERELHDGRHHPPSPARVEFLETLWGPSPSRASAKIASLLAQLTEGSPVSAICEAGSETTPRRATG